MVIHCNTLRPKLRHSNDTVLHFPQVTVKRRPFTLGADVCCMGIFQFLDPSEELTAPCSPYSGIVFFLR